MLLQRERSARRPAVSRSGQPRERADLTPVYAMMIFRHLRAVGADWVHRFPELGSSTSHWRTARTHRTRYSVTQAGVAELQAQQRRAEVERFRAELRDTNARVCEDAMDQLPPAIVRAHQQVYGRDARG
jgi:hypothetical protein